MDDTTFKYHARITDLILSDAKLPETEGDVIREYLVKADETSDAWPSLIQLVRTLQEEESTDILILQEYISCIRENIAELYSEQLNDPSKITFFGHLVRLLEAAAETSQFKIISFDLFGAIAEISPDLAPNQLRQLATLFSTNGDKLNAIDTLIFVLNRSSGDNPIRSSEENADFTVLHELICSMNEGDIKTFTELLPHKASTLETIFETFSATTTWYGTALFKALNPKEMPDTPIHHQSQPVIGKTYSLHLGNKDVGKVAVIITPANGACFYESVAYGTHNLSNKKYTESKDDMDTMLTGWDIREQIIAELQSKRTQEPYFSALKTTVTSIIESATTSDVLSDTFYHCFFVEHPNLKVLLKPLIAAKQPNATQATVIESIRQCGALPTELQPVMQAIAEKFSENSDGFVIERLTKAITDCLDDPKYRDVVLKLLVEENGMNCIPIQHTVGENLYQISPEVWETSGIDMRLGLIFENVPKTTPFFDHIKACVREKLTCAYNDRLEAIRDGVMRKLVHQTLDVVWGVAYEKYRVMIVDYDGETFKFHSGLSDIDNEKDIKKGILLYYHDNHFDFLQLMETPKRSIEEVENHQSSEPPAKASKREANSNPSTSSKLG